MTDTTNTLQAVETEKLVAELQSRHPWGCIFIWSNNGDDMDWWHSGTLNNVKGMIYELSSDIIGRGCAEIEDE